jgi:hypothetical protein
MIPKGTGLNFGQEGQRPNVYQNGGEASLSIDCMTSLAGTSLAGELQCTARRPGNNS